MQEESPYFKLVVLNYYTGGFYPLPRYKQRLTIALD